ncbi:MAG: hypothetical protein O2910_07775 [Proteobacteria bacterium]|nr:hypothetical protein [Pseudomonadota bacterium]
MLFSSLEFIFVFLPIVVLGYVLAGRAFSGDGAIAAPLFFYGWWNWLLLPLIVLSILFNFGIGVLLSRTEVGAKRRKFSAWLVFGVATNLLVLGYFKYANFFVDNLQQIPGVTLQLAEILLPIGISFFTFQQIAYLVDARRRATAEHGFLHYCLL